MKETQLLLARQETLADASADGKAVDVFPPVCRATLDAMLRCALSFRGTIQGNK